jgi:hypothetical protein
MDRMEPSKYACIVIGAGPPPELPSFRSLRTYSGDLLSAISEYEHGLGQTLFYIYAGQQATPWSEVHAAILAGFPVCIPVTDVVLAAAASADFITFSHAVFLYPMLRAVIYADSREELREPPCRFLKDRIVIPSHMYFELNAYHDFTYEPLKGVPHI